MVPPLVLVRISVSLAPKVMAAAATTLPFGAHAQSDGPLVLVRVPVQLIFAPAVTAEGNQVADHWLGTPPTLVAAVVRSPVSWQHRE
jgi:hypothetical protein